MAHNYNKIKQGRAGFTIVELLIVIVVIGILAAITIVAYSGITARANGAKAQTNGANTQKVAEAMNADNGYYPATAASFATGSTSTKEPTGITVIPDTITGASAVTSLNGMTTVAYACLSSCANSTGGRIAWWNYGVAIPAADYIYVGSATSSGTFVAPAS